MGENCYSEDKRGIKTCKQQAREPEKKTAGCFSYRNATCFLFVLLLHAFQKGVMLIVACAQALFHAVALSGRK